MAVGREGSAMVEQRFDTGTASINYMVEGREDGAPIVFLHGVTGRWQAWLPAMTAFAAEWRGDALRPRGAGGGRGRAGGYPGLGYAARRAGLLPPAGGGPAGPVGVS